MTTIDSAFIANGMPTGVGRRVGIGFYAKAQSSLPSAVSGPFTIGAQAWGQQAGVCGATDDVGQIALQPWSYAGVIGRRRAMRQGKIVDPRRGMRKQG